MSRWEIRAARAEDEDELLSVARHLDTVNLPDDRPAIRQLLRVSAESFGGLLPRRHRRFVFVLWDHEEKTIVGTSMIVAQLGTRDAPYIYLDVIDEEKYSRLLDRHFHHTVLRIGYSYDGPTEIGGLVVRPDYRRATERLGLLISYVRFLYVAAHRDLFEDELLAELLPPLEADGTSLLWEAFGRHFTSMSYQEADRLSSQNKDFIRDLFPSGVVYASLFSKEAQEIIGRVGPQTKGVEKMLRRIGFRYADRVDPFDGGPHFTAETDEVTLVAAARRARVGKALRGDERAARRALLARDFAGPPYFRAVPTQVVDTGEAVHAGAADLEALGASTGDEVIVLALP